jgi:hypothetical protein
MSLRSWLWALSFAIASSSCESEPHDAELLPRFAKHGCNQRLVIATTPENMTGATACALATTALDYVGDGGARSIGVVPDDTARLSHASVQELVELPKDDAPIIDYYWQIALSAPDRIHHVRIRISRVTGKLTPEPRDLSPDQP